MKEVCIVFNILPDGHVTPNGYQKIPCHMIFDVKMEDFCPRLVAGGHRIKAPATITYASVVSCVKRDPKVLRRVSQILNKEGLHFANLFYIFE